MNTKFLQILNFFQRPSNGMKFHRGLTLIELLVTISILGLIVVVVGNLFISSTRLGNDEQIRIDVGESTSRVLGPLDEILRQGKEVLPTAVIDGTTYTSSATVLVFSLPSLDSAGSTISGTSDTAVIFLDSSNADNPTIHLIVSPASGTFRPGQDSTVIDRAKDLYIRYTSDGIASAQAATLTIQISKDIQTKTFTRTNVLYAVFRNHP